MRIASDKEITLRDGNLGWIHTSGNVASSRPREYHQTAAEINIDVPTILRRYSMDTTLSAAEDIAGSLGVTRDSLSSLGMVWSNRYQAWAFPMWCENGGFWEASGIRLRSLTGQKWSVRGSHSGLFIPSKLSGAGPLCICEGPTDTAAMLDLRFDAIGRVSCMGSVELVKSFLAGKRQDVVICADKDVPGQHGAYRLALELRLQGRKLKVITPLKGKDVRAWKQQGATRDLVIAVINNSRWETLSQLQSRVNHLLAAMASSRTAKPSGSTQKESPGCLSGSKSDGSG